LEGVCLGDLAAAYHALGQPKWAVDLGSQSLRIAREIRNVRSEASILGTLGRCYVELGDARRAIVTGKGMLLEASGTPWRAQATPGARLGATRNF
jgi:hypothetical protein